MATAKMRQEASDNVDEMRGILKRRSQATCLTFWIHEYREFLLFLTLSLIFCLSSKIQSSENFLHNFGVPFMRVTKNARVRAQKLPKKSVEHDWLRYAAQSCYFFAKSRCSNPPQNPTDEPQNDPRHQLSDEEGSEYQNYEVQEHDLTFSGEMEKLADVLQNNLGSQWCHTKIFCWDTRTGDCMAAEVWSRRAG